MSFDSLRSLRMTRGGGGGWWWRGSGGAEEVVPGEDDSVAEGGYCTVWELLHRLRIKADILRLHKVPDAASETGWFLCDSDLILDKEPFPWADRPA